MRKFYMLLAFAILILWPMSALADTTGGASPSPSPTDSESAASAVFAIDDVHVYLGMDKAYKDGYMPKVSDSTATVILPLVASGAVKANRITVTPGLGDASASPFVFKNYQKTVVLANNGISGGKTVQAYLVRFDLPLKSGRTNGVYPVTVEVKAEDAGGNQIDQTFTDYVTITDGKSAKTSGDTAKTSPKPKVIVEDYTVNPSPAVAGKAFTASVTLRNTSKTKAVQNMTVEVTCDSPKFSLQNKSGTFFIRKLGKGEAEQIDIKYKTDLDTPEQQYNLALAISYDISDGTEFTSAGIVQVPVGQPQKVQMGTPKIPEQVNAGDTMPLSIQVMNMGRSKIYNVRCDLSAPGLIPSATAFVGNMEGGTSSEGQMDVFVGTKDMTEGYTGTDKYGDTSGKLTLTYEDANGKEYKQDQEISTTINEPVIPAAKTDKEKKPETAGQWWISIAIGAVFIAALAGVIIHNRNKGKKHEEL